MATFTGFETGTAERFFTRGTAADAARAVALLAATATGFAFAANRLFTSEARVAVLLAYQRAAVITIRTAPILKLYEGRLRVVGLQDRRREGEEVEEPTARESLANRRVAIALAKHVVHDVRVSNISPAFARMWVLGDNFVGRRARV